LPRHCKSLQATALTIEALFEQANKWLCQN
jgi:hypothetical protein